MFKKKVKKLTVSKAKKKTWAIFSLYIRTRDTNKLARYLGGDKVERVGSCFTCGKLISSKEGQAGHFIQGRHSSVLFDPRNTHLQCVGCNLFKSGNLIPYYEKMLKEYGQEVIDELKSLDKQIKQFKVDELISLKEYYEQKLKELEKRV